MLNSDFYSSSLHKIQVTGADLVYLRSKKITKKRLPEILVRRAEENQK